MSFLMVQCFLFLGIPILLKDKLDIFASSYSRINESDTQTTHYSSRLRTFLGAYKWSCRLIALAALTTIFLGIYQYGLIILNGNQGVSSLTAPRATRPSAAVSSFEWNENTRAMSLIGLFTCFALLKVYLIISDIINGLNRGTMNIARSITKLCCRTE